MTKQSACCRGEVLAPLDGARLRASARAGWRGLTVPTATRSAGEKKGGATRDASTCLLGLGDGRTASTTRLCSE
jgi:hypothetical protein